MLDHVFKQTSAPHIKCCESCIFMVIVLFVFLSIHGSSQLSMSVQGSGGQSSVNDLAARISDYTTADMNFSAMYIHQVWYILLDCLSAHSAIR